MFSMKLKQLRRGQTSTPGIYNTSRNNDNSITTDTALQRIDPVVYNPFLGLLYMFLHAIFNQLASVMIKKLPYINPCQLSFIRHAGIFVAVLPVAVYHTNQIFGEKKQRLLLFMRSFLSATAFHLQIMAYSYLPLAEASVILSTLPMVTAAMAGILLKEPYGLVQSICSIVTVCGVLLAIRVPELISNRNGVPIDFTYITGLLASVGNVLLLALSSVYVRKLKKVSFLVILIYLGLVGATENAVVTGIFFSFVPADCGLDQILCISFAAFCFISNGFSTKSIQVEPAGLATIQKSSFDVLIIIVLQIIFFNVYPDFYVICGACLVIASLTVVGFQNWILIIPETSKVRRNFKWLL